jgi:hypothetical protein
VLAICEYKVFVARSHSKKNMRGKLFLDFLLAISLQEKTIYLYPGFIKVALENEVYAVKY